MAAAIDATGKRIAVGGSTSLVIQAPDGSGLVRLHGHRKRVNAVVFSPNSDHLLSGSDDRTARVRNARKGGRVRTLPHDGVVRGVSYSNDGRRIATASSDEMIRVWPAADGDPVILSGHEGAVNTAEFNDSGDRIVSAGEDGTIRVWDAGGGDALVILHQHEGIASGADFGVATASSAPAETA